MKRILKWTVPIDDQRHPIGSGPVLRVECQFNPYEVQVWTEETDNVGEAQAQVYGTGHLYPDEGRAVGTVMVNPVLVWHVVAFDA